MSENKQPNQQIETKGSDIEKELRLLYAAHITQSQMDHFWGKRKGRGLYAGGISIRQDRRRVLMVLPKWTKNGFNNLIHRLRSKDCFDRERDVRHEKTMRDVPQLIEVCMQNMTRDELKLWASHLTYQDFRGAIWDETPHLWFEMEKRYMAEEYCVENYPRLKAEAERHLMLRVEEKEAEQ